ncbi:glycosyltransferase family 4 protein [Halobacterium hubeiense]|uniref:glycosyltransferase family 4 protein n=1 Tax=Halobacterium hubeiense TaxID=1407499 RepID=UPI000B7D01F6|nr:glycosyltransferase family 4 protein [Halobacterium hubeiense]
MDVAFVSNVVYPFVTGGAEKRIHEIGTRLVERDHDVTVYGRHFWDGPRETTHEGMMLRAVSPERELYGEDGQRSIGEALEFAKDVVRPLRRNAANHDVVVASVFPYFPVLAAKLALAGTRTPLVTTWHEVWGDYWNEYLGTLGPFGKGVEHATARVPQYPIAVSGVTADRLAARGQPRERIRTVPNGIDYDQIRGVEPAADAYDVLFAGRLIEDKRVDVLLDAFDAVDTDATLGIIGDGPQRNALERQAATLDSAGRVTFLGFLGDYEDVLAHMRGARVFASPSTREGFGITYAEAMAAGCLVVGADHPNSAADEVIQDGGFLVEPTVDALAETLERSLRGVTPPANPEDVARQFDWDNVATKAAEAYGAAIDDVW